MKQCPACGNTYTNDQLVFCLEDGAALVNVSESRREFDPQATLRVDSDATLQLSDEAANQLAPTEAAVRRAEPTTKRPAPPETSPPRARHETHGDRTHDAATPAAPGHNRALVVMLGAIALILLVIAGVGVALLLRSSSGSEQKTTENRALESNANRNATVNVNSSPANANSKPPSNANNANNRNGTTTAPDGFARAEAKVVRGTALTDNDLTGLVNEELRRLRNSVYARHGRMFDAPELQRYFDSRPWYKPHSDYNDQSLTATDRANIKLIQDTETRR